MKETELRIGNLVSQNGFQCLVYSIESAMPRREERFNDKVLITLYDSGLATVTLDQVSAVVLTEEWLFKFGFAKQDYTMSGCNIYKLGNIIIMNSFVNPQRESMGITIEGISPPTWSLKDLRFVHQLQNMYFALTGKELTLN
jgi:hypothetical protein